jgi:hypothetical protein
MTPWSAKPGLGTPEGEAMVILLAGARRGMRVSLPHDVTWLVKGVALVSRRLPEPSAADCPNWVWRFAHNGERLCVRRSCLVSGGQCRAASKDEARRAAIAAARGGAR